MHAQIQNPLDYKQMYKNERPSENEFHKKTVRTFQTEKNNTFLA